MVKILVSGKSKSSGKTTFIEKMIKNLKGKIFVIKSSIHDKYDKFELIDDKEIILEKNTDTEIFSRAGADKVFYLKSNQENLKEGLNKKLNNIEGYDYLIVEGNSIIDYIGFNLIYYMDKKGGDKKKSAEKCKKRADIIIDSDNDYAIEFNQDVISCLKAHILGHSLDIPLSQVGNMIDEANIKVKNCQLGLF